MSKKITDFFSNKSNESENNSRGPSTRATSETSAATTSETSSDLANPSLASQRKKTDRTLNSSTLKKWISEDLAPSNAFVWLKHEENGHGQV